ncbi:unnamed protein product [Rhodiola kirilowii]
MEHLEFVKVYLPEEISEMMDIPIELLDQFKGEIGRKSYLIGPNGEESLVKLTRWKDKRFFFKGWRDFIFENCVSSTDLMLFRYEGNLRFNVNIFSTSGCESEVQGGRFNVSDRQPMFFKVFVPEQSSAQMLIPIEFVERNMKGEKNDYAELVVGSGEQWHVGFVLKVEGWFFNLGWGLFLADNGIEPFDFLVFIYAGNMKFTVKIFGKNGCTKLPPSPSSPIQNINEGVRHGFENSGRGRRHVPTPDEQIVVDSFTSNRPLFVRTLKWPPNQSATLNMPRSFLTQHSITLYNEQEIVLRFQRNSHHPWCVKVRRNNSLYVYTFGKGFTTFLRGNNIIDGDVLVFEVFKTSPLELLVYIGYRPTTEA